MRNGGGNEYIFKSVEGTEAAAYVGIVKFDDFNYSAGWMTWVTRYVVN